MNITVAGIGIIGGSLAKACTRAGYTVSVWNRTRSVAERAVSDGTAVSVADDNAIRQSDIVFVALPPGAIEPWISEHCSLFKHGAIITDCCGVKRVICDAMRKFEHGAEWTFVGGHPMAGREVSGYESALATLFDGASMILTPFPSTATHVVDALKSVLLKLGFSNVVTTTPERHDEMIALTSQLAHIVSSAYIQDQLAPAFHGFSAGSFADMTRVATLDPALWTELFLDNRDAVLNVLDRLLERLGSYRKALIEKDAVSLKQLLERGKTAKEKLKSTEI